MQGTSGRRLSLLFRRPAAFLLAFLLVAPSLAVLPRSAAQEADGVELIVGTFATSNPIVLQLVAQPYMMLWDMTAYVLRDDELPVPREAQIIAPLLGDLATGSADFAIPLPIKPQGQLNDVDGNGEDDAGVQIFSIDFGANAIGDPFVDEHEGTGWGQTYTSLDVIVGEWEVIGGQVLVWAPDGNQQFPTDLGPDGRFLTDDDPVGPIDAGWTLIDLNTSPFAQIRTPVAEATILEGDDGFTDLSDHSFTDAFELLFDELEIRYAFTELKGIDWDALWDAYWPRIEAAEADDDLYAYNLAVMEFAAEFNDGHVAASPPPGFVAEVLGGRLGMILAETDDEEVVVLSVTRGLPANRAGIEVGAVILEWNGLDPIDAAEATPKFAGHSTDHSRRSFQYLLMTRGPLGDTVEVTFENPNGSTDTAVLTYSEDIDGRDTRATLETSDVPFNLLEQPVTSSLLPSGIGYIRVNTFFADTLLMASAWDYAIETLNEYGVPGLIVDMRGNGGGLGYFARYMAGSFYDEPFELFQRWFISPDGRIFNEGSDMIYTAAPRFEAPVAVIIDGDCASACEIFSAAVAANPNNLIVGYTPTAGVLASIFSWRLPGDIDFQASIRWVELDGEIAIEGVGVPPNVRVPATYDNLLDPGDELLAITESELIPVIIEYLTELSQQEDDTDQPEEIDDLRDDGGRPVPDVPLPGE